MLRCLFILGWLASAAAHARAELALPSLERHDSDLDGFVNATRSTLIVDQLRTRGAYVMPPDSGTVSVRQVTLESNVELCPQMRALQESARAVSAEIAREALDTSAFEAELALLRTQRRDAENRSAEYSDYRRSLEAADELALDLADLSFRRAQLLSQFCPAAGSCPPDVASELDAIGAREGQLAAERAALERDAAVRQALYRQALLELAAIADAIAAREQAHFAILDQLSELHRSLFEMYAVYALLGGGRAEIAYESGWRETVERLRAGYPSHWFEPMPTREARVHVTMIPGIGTDAYLASLPAVQEYTVNGRSVALGDPIEAWATYPESIQAEAHLSLVSACAVAEPGAYDLEVDTSAVPLFGLTVSYEYPAVSPVDIAVRCNLWRLSQLARAAHWGVRELAGLLELARNEGVLTFDWTSETATVEPELRRTFELRVLWQLLQAWWAVSRSPRYVPDSVRTYGGPSETTGGSLPAAVTGGLVLKSVSGDPRYADELAQVQLGRFAVKGDRRVLAVALGTRESLTGVALPAAAMMVPLDTQADRLVQRVTSRQTIDAVATDRAPIHVGDSGAAVVYQALSLPRNLTPEATLVIFHSLSLARRSLERSCGFYHLSCQGLAWIEQPDWSAQLQASFDREQTLRYARSAVTFRQAVTSFRP